MCRFALYLGKPIRISSLVTDPDNSIIHQSFHSHERAEPLNGDGFGLAWYAGGVSPIPAFFKDISPAWNNLNLLELARLTETGCLLAHVRAASPGLTVMRLNCHPFGWGNFAFMHNGSIGGFARLRRQLRQSLSDSAEAGLQGTTDSEHLFALFRDNYESLTALQPLERMVEGLRAAVGETERLRRALAIEEPSFLNLALADGRRAVAIRYVSDKAAKADSLYVNVGQRYSCSDGLCQMEDGDSGAVLVCSEPLSAQESWRPVPVNHLVAVDDDLTVTIRPLDL
ncbi:MAG: class II glutamine amidotransferase [Thermoanaerobaculia bacterium]|nr:class II glutamine amidotransferase [Thermoanaerobaculia bacterium]